MKKRFLAALLFTLSLHTDIYAKADLWQKTDAANVQVEEHRKLQPDKFTTLSVNTASLAMLLQKASAAETVIDLPLPDGRTMSFRIWETPMMEKALADKYPGIKTYTAVALDDQLISAKIDMTYKGFHAMIMDGRNMSFIDPYTDNNDQYYICYNKKDYTQTVGKSMVCSVADVAEDVLHRERISLTDNGIPALNLKVGGTIKSVYRLALATTVEYSVAVAGASPTKAAVLSAMVTTMNRVNGVYEKELAVQMTLVGNTDDLIYITNPDPYSNGSGSAMQAENQDNVDAVIGTLNYDIGHVFSTGGGGIADLGCVCDNDSKARGVTGRPNPIGDPFDIDYVAHEIGHQFGATHTFNASTGSCNGNIVQLSAYEPGSGSTIMAYAGICTGNNIQAASNDYFHARSLDQISGFITAPLGGAMCASATVTGNTPPSIPPFSQTYNIPYKTPFELIAPEAVDNDHDVLTYCWEEYDLGDFGSSFSSTMANGPIFRSFNPVASRTRVFPTLDKLLNNETSYLGEKLPEVDRNLTFRLTVRDVKDGVGSFNFPTDAIELNVVNTGTPFAVTSPNTNADYWQMGSTVTVNWNVANTASSPISCANVDILLSIDNGYTYPFTLAANTANDGSETVTVPNAPTGSARVKVKGVGNVFFDLSNAPFTINSWPADVNTITADKARISIYPVPAKDVLFISMNDTKAYTLSVTNAMGQNMMHRSVKDKAEIAVSEWPNGVYYIQLINAEGDRIVKNFVVE